MSAPLTARAGAIKKIHSLALIVKVQHVPAMFPRHTSMFTEFWVTENLAAVLQCIFVLFALVGFLS